MRSRFSRYNVVENRKFTKWPQNDLKHLTVKSVLYTLNNHRWCPNFTLFRSTTSLFRDTWPKTRNAPNDPRMTLTTSLSKVPSPVYTEYSSPRPKCQSVSLYDKPFSRYNVVENRKCTECTHLIVKVPCMWVPCIHWILTPCPKFHPVLLYDCRFPRYWQFFNSHWPQC